MNAAETGRLPDRLVRVGIRQLLRARLRDIDRADDGHALSDFLMMAQGQQIAVVPDRANEQHYEVPAEFFQRVLGPALKYSSCYWAPGVDALDVAEEEGLRVTCENAGLQDGMDILELGCGWGSLSLWMAEAYPNARITSVSNSHSQREFIELQAERRGIENLSVITADMNDFATNARFDRVVSVEMFEHMRNHQKLMHRIYGWLRPGGRLFTHIFCHKTTPYLYDTDGDHNWMGRHFFTGGMMPSQDLLPQCTHELTLVNQWKWNGQHYAKTCRAWLSQQDAAEPRILELFAQTYGTDNAVRWYNRWRLFFMACEELFAYNGGNEWFVSHYLFER